MPAVIVSSNDMVIPALNFETTITAGGEPVEGALVCLSQDTVYVKGFTDELGNISLEHPFVEGDILLVVTAFNTTTIYETISVNGALELPEPINLTYITENANHVVLSWEEPEDRGMTVKGYNVYRDDVLMITEPVAETTFTDIVPRNGEYKYEVTALYSETLESEFSNSVTALIDGMCIPIRDEIVVEQTEGANLLISWTAPEYEGLELAGYNIYRNSEQINTEIIPATELSFLDEDLAPDTEYCYRVEVVYNDCDERLQTDEKCFILLSVNDNMGEKEISIFPNPTTGEFTIDNRQLTINNIEIFFFYFRKVSSHHLIT
jgi:fibronectin type 3 domain-containing protein